MPFYPQKQQKQKQQKQRKSQAWPESLLLRPQQEPMHLAPKFSLVSTLVLMYNTFSSNGCLRRWLLSLLLFFRRWLSHPKSVDRPPPPSISKYTPAEQGVLVKESRLASNKNGASQKSQADVPASSDLPRSARRHPTATSRRCCARYWKNFLFFFVLAVVVGVISYFATNRDSSDGGPVNATTTAAPG